MTTNPKILEINVSFETLPADFCVSLLNKAKLGDFITSTLIYSSISYRNQTLFN